MGTHDRKAGSAGTGGVDSNEVVEPLDELTQLAAVGQLASGVAHRFNNLLTTILGYAEVVESHHLDDPDDVDACEQIKEAARRAATMAKELQIVSSRRKHSGERVDVNTVAASIHTLLAGLSRRDAPVTIALAASDLIVRVETNEIEQMLVHLVLDAQEASGEGAAIDVELSSVADVPPGIAAAETAVANGWLRITAAETGAVAAASDAGQRARPGLMVPERDSLSLAVIRNLAAQNGGAVHVARRSPGRAVTVFLPLASASAPDHRGTVLVVDDDACVRRVVARLLRSAGHEVLEASDIAEASGMVGAAADVLVTDLVMPDGTGDAVAAHLRAHRPQAGVLYLTGCSQASKLPHTDERTLVLAKPFRAEALVAAVGELMALACGEVEVLVEADDAVALEAVCRHH